MKMRKITKDWVLRQGNYNMGDLAKYMEEIQYR